MWRPACTECGYISAELGSFVPLTFAQSSTIFLLYLGYYNCFHTVLCLASKPMLRVIEVTETNIRKSKWSRPGQVWAKCKLMSPVYLVRELGAVAFLASDTITRRAIVVLVDFSSPTLWYGFSSSMISIRWRLQHWYEESSFACILVWQFWDVDRNCNQIVITVSALWPIRDKPIFPFANKLSLYAHVKRPVGNKVKHPYFHGNVAYVWSVEWLRCQT
jgi:hypothetical protein